MRRALLLLLAAPACNLVTGIDQIQIQGSGGDGGSSGGAGGSGGDGGSGASTGNAGGQGVGGGTGGTGNAGTGGTGAGGSAPTCSPACGANQFCEPQTLTCQCSPGFVTQGGACVAAPVGDPTTHTQQEVCQTWQAGHAVTDPSPFSSGGGMCDPGTLSQGGLNDTLVRMNMFRWLVGLGPVDDDAGLNQMNQYCANLESWWDFSMGGSPHSPPASATCYTAQGASGAGQSNIAWGSGHPAQAIDQFMEDWGNETTLGHRRWIMNPPLGPVGIGYWQGGGQYGNAMCLAVFGSSGGGPTPPWTSVPAAGFAPIETAQWTWSFQGNLSGIGGAQVTMLDVDTNQPLAIQILPLQGGFGQEAISWVPQGWTAQAGKTYRVTVAGVSGGPIIYDVKPVAC